MSLAVFARNPKERDVLLRMDVAVVGLGTLGGALVDMLARAGVGRLTLIDPEDFSAENVGRHILDCRSIGKSKAYELAQHVSLVNPSCYVTALQEKFDIRPERPDLILSGADSFECSSLGEQLCNPPWDSGGFRRRLGRGFGGGDSLHGAGQD